MIYNYDLNVKYNQIETQLMDKTKTSTDYSAEDVQMVCSRLYQEEIMHALGIDDFEEQSEIMYDRMKIMFEQLTSVSELQALVNEWSNMWETDLIMLSFFSQPMFHVTHHALQQLKSTGVIKSELIEQIKQHMQ